MTTARVRDPDGTEYEEDDLFEDEDFDFEDEDDEYDDDDEGDEYDDEDDPDPKEGTIPA